MKISILIFLITFSSIEVLSQKDPACYCMDYHNNISNYSTPLLEFHIASTGMDFLKTTKVLDEDSVFFQNQLLTSEYEKLKDFFTFNISNEKPFLKSPIIGFAIGKDTSLVNSLFKNYQEKNLRTEDRFRLIWSQKPTIINKKLLYTMYAVKWPEETEVILRGESVENARSSKLPTDTTMSISIIFDDDGSEIMNTLSSQNIGNFLLLISHDKVLSAPAIFSSIDHGYILIDGKFTKEEATSLSNWINCDEYSRRIGQNKFKNEMKKCK